MLGPDGVEGEFETVACPLCGATEQDLLFERAEDELLGHPGTFSIVGCKACSVRYLTPQPVGETLVGYYRPNGSRSYPDNEAHRIRTWPDSVRWALNKDRGWPAPEGDEPTAAVVDAGRKHLANHPERFRMLPWRGEGRILDIGCGSGSYLAMMGAMGWKPEGTNLIPEVCQDIESRLGIPCHQGHLVDLDLPPASFDAITLWHVLEHLPDPPAVLKKIKTLLKPGGVLAIGVPVFDSMEAELLGPAWLGYDVPRHLLTFSRERLRSFLRDSGFTVEGLHSEPRTKIVKISVLRGPAPAYLKLAVRSGKLLRAYVNRLTKQNRIGTVVALATH